MTKITAAIALAALSFTFHAAYAATAPAEGLQCVDRYGTVVSETPITADGMAMLEVLVQVDKGERVVRFVQPTSMLTQGEGSRVLIQVENGRPMAVNVD